MNDILIVSQRNHVPDHYLHNDHYDVLISAQNGMEHSQVQFGVNMRSAPSLRDSNLKPGGRISINEGMYIMTDTATIGALQTDITALVETNVHWNQSTQDKYPTNYGANLYNQEWCVPQICQKS